MKKISLITALALFAAIPIAPSDTMEDRRNRMVDEQIVHRGITDPRVVTAMRKVPRHEFVPLLYQWQAYDDHPLPIGYDQTISQPYIVAFMTAAVELKGGERVLEIGTGSGYQAAVLAELAREVYSVEIVEGLASQARQRLKELGYDNVVVKHGDGYKGFKEHAPYDAIVVTAAPDAIPPELVNQLKTGGRMVIPIGSFYQELYLVTKTAEGMVTKRLLPVRFVPMVTEEGDKY